jgi:hypothetical protein
LRHSRIGKAERRFRTDSIFRLSIQRPDPICREKDSNLGEMAKFVPGNEVERISVVARIIPLIDHVCSPKRL